ncbi:MAG: aspartate-semialdehyde dehydrogenase [Calditrichaeota bacterium]|nr:aspartate-semialdehyde dehydrogenase [Calditrichota bacterium]MCB9367975.1 aspartate-semialdehyde dehydrogenase [Calditrichota bacterium]
MKPVRLAIVGATGMVGQTTLSILEEWKVPISELSLFASTSGRSMTFRGEEIPVHGMQDRIEADYAILALSSDLSRDLAPMLAANGVRVIDHSSAHRMNAAVPLVIPEINSHAMNSNVRLVANPNCSASIVLMALAPLEKEIGLKRVIVSTYQSVSGAGASACDELSAQIMDPSHAPQIFPCRVMGNVFPEIGPFESTNYTGEETKISQEIRKILERKDLHVSATAVRVPVNIGHAASVSVEMQRPFAVSEVAEALSSFSGLVFDARDYSTPLDIAGKQDVRVGRVRIDSQDKNWLHFWVVGDNLRKGAASNAVQILQHWTTL